MIGRDRAAAGRRAAPPRPENVAGQRQVGPQLGADRARQRVGARARARAPPAAADRASRRLRAPGRGAAAARSGGASPCRVEHRVVDAHRRREHRLRRRQRAGRADARHVEPGQVGLGARQLDRRVQPALDLGGGHVAVSLGAREGVLGGAQHGVRALHRRSRTSLHHQLDAQPFGVRVMPLALRTATSADRRLGGDAAEVEHLLIGADGASVEALGSRAAAGHRGAADAREVDLGDAEDRGRGVVGGPFEGLRGRPDAGQPLRPGHARIGSGRGDPRERGAQRRLVRARVGERLVERHPREGPCPSADSPASSGAAVEVPAKLTASTAITGLARRNQRDTRSPGKAQAVPGHHPRAGVPPSTSPATGRGNPPDPIGNFSLSGSKSERSQVHCACARAVALSRSRSSPMFPGPHLITDVPGCTSLPMFPVAPRYRCSRLHLATDVPGCVLARAQAAPVPGPLSLSRGEG